MPVERTSKGFKDVSGSFQINPVNNDLIVIKNETAIARSVRNLVLTVPGDKPFAPNIGSRVSEMLFENMDELTASAIRVEIENTINSYEPRVELIKVEVNPNFDDNAFDVLIEYDIIGIDASTQQLSFALQPTR